MLSGLQIVRYPLHLHAIVGVAVYVEGTQINRRNSDVGGSQRGAGGLPTRRIDAGCAIGAALPLGGTRRHLQPFDAIEADLIDQQIGYTIGGVVRRQKA